MPIWTGNALLTNQQYLFTLKPVLSIRNSQHSKSGLQSQADVPFMSHLYQQFSSTTVPNSGNQGRPFPLEQQASFIACRSKASRQSPCKEVTPLLTQMGKAKLRQTLLAALIPDSSHAEVIKYGWPWELPHQAHSASSRTAISFFAAWLLSVSGICKYITRTGLRRTLYVLPHRDRSCTSNLLSHRHQTTRPAAGRVGTRGPVVKSLVPPYQVQWWSIPLAQMFIGWSLFRQTGQQTDQSTHRPVNRQTGQQTDWSTDRPVNRQTGQHRPVNRQTGQHRPVNRQTGQHTDRSTDRPVNTDRSTDRPVNTQTSQHTDRSTDDRSTHRPVNTQTSQHTDRSTHRPVNTQTGQHTDQSTDDRSTHRPVNRRPVNTQTGQQTTGQHRLVNRQTGQHTDRSTDRPVNRQTGQHTDRSTDRPVNTQTGQQTDRSTDRHDDAHTTQPEMDTHCSSRESTQWDGRYQTTAITMEHNFSSTCLDTGTISPTTSSCDTARIYW